MDKIDTDILICKVCKKHEIYEEELRQVIKMKEDELKKIKGDIDNLSAYFNSI